jgi:hypothetical protein
VGTHPAAGGQFLLCYRHHPDFQGKRPTHEMIERLHREHLARVAALHDRLEEMHGRGAATGSQVGSADEATGEPARAVDVDDLAARVTQASSG